MRSMTGFGQSSGANENHRVSVHLRSVNSRFLDLVIKLKEEHKVLEPRVRRVLERGLERGRVDATIEIRSLRPLSAEVAIQTEVVLALHRASHELVEKGLVVDELGVGDLLRMPEVVEIRVAADSLDDSGWQLLEQHLQAAQEQLITSRRAEGSQLRAVLSDRASGLAAVVDQLGELVAGVQAATEARLRGRLETLLVDLSLDESRLAQEVAILVDKADVSEELDRLAGHVAQFRTVLEANSPVGRRLDFLTQELMRELNTLGSKARDTEVTRCVLEGKLICEQLKEQIQNVE